MSKRMTIAGALTIASVASSLLFPSAATAAENIPEKEITLGVDTVNGTGCPAGSAAVTPSSDSTAFTVTYSAFKARGRSFKNCHMVVKVHVPEGLTYAIHKVENRGYTYLGQGASGKHTMLSYFSGQSHTMKSQQNFSGPYDDVWQDDNTADVLDWAPCDVDRYLNINNVLRVSGPQDNYIDMFSTDASVSTVFHLQWKTCA